jgi:CheY-like chemotaxis protein
VMPKMDGLTLAIKLREQLPQCRILLISGNAYTSEFLSEWRSNGGPELEMLAKPVPPEIIIRKLTAMAVAGHEADLCQNNDMDGITPLELPGREQIGTYHPR